MPLSIRTSFYLLAGLLAFTSANLLPEPTTDPIADNVIDKRANCGIITGALAILTILGPPATSFCSSYLRVATAVIATRTAAVPRPVYVLRHRSSKYLTNRTVFLELSPPPHLQSTSEYLLSCASQAELEFTRGARRRARKRIKLPALSACAASQLSSGCSCLNIVPKTTIMSIITPVGPLSITKAPAFSSVIGGSIVNVS
jgi:hypothetical protein